MGTVKIQPEILEWAIIQSGIPKDDLIQRQPRIEEWLSEEKLPTFKQLIAFSKWLKIPFGLLFLKTPPPTDGINVEFRTINQKLHTSFSKDLRDTLLEMERRKSWMSEYNQKNGIGEIQWDISIGYSDTSSSAAKKLREFLGLEEFWQGKLKTQYNQFKFIREIIESKGALVMMNGIVGNNTHRVLDVLEFRAFALSDPYSPLIFINRNDTESGMIFSIIHEIIHLIIERDKDDILLEDTTIANERKINSFAAEFLVPTKLLKQVFDKFEDIFFEVDRIANIFNVSTTVVAIKMYKLQLIDFETQNDIISDAKRYFLLSKKQRENKPSGGNFYSTAASRISKNFYNTVIHQAESGKIQFTEAYRLLNLKGKTYDGFKLYVNKKLYD